MVDSVDSFDTSPTIPFPAHFHSHGLISVVILNLEDHLASARPTMPQIPTSRQGFIRLREGPQMARASCLPTHQPRRGFAFGRRLHGLLAGADEAHDVRGVHHHGAGVVDAQVVVRKGGRIWLAAHLRHASDVKLCLVGCNANKLQQLITLKSCGTMKNLIQLTEAFR